MKHEVKEVKKDPCVSVRKYTIECTCGWKTSGDKKEIVVESIMPVV